MLSMRDATSDDGLEVCRYFDRRRAVVLVRCDDCKGGLIRRQRTLSTFSFYADRPRVAVTAGINPPGWTPRMWRRLARFIESSGWEAASHTMDHPRLTQVDEARVRHELTVSRDVIVSGLERAGLEGIDVSTFIYPYGDYGTREIEILRQTGYALALTFRTEEGVTAIPKPASWYEWGYTVNAPELQPFDSLLDQFQAVYESGQVFSVTTHPPVVRPDRRLRAANVYRRSGSWSRLLDETCAMPDVWFTTFGTLAAYHAQSTTALLRRAQDGKIVVTYEAAAEPLPRPPLTVAFRRADEPASVLFDGAPLPRLERVADVPTVGWRFESDRVVATVSTPGTLMATDSSERVNRLPSAPPTPHA